MLVWGKSFSESRHSQCKGPNQLASILEKQGRGRCGPDGMEESESVVPEVREGRAGRRGHIM